MAEFIEGIKQKMYSVSIFVKLIIFMLLSVIYSNIANAQPIGLLTDQDQERLRQEEIFREEIKKQIAKQTATSQTWGVKLWVFLNSTFGIWLLSTVAVGLVTFLYSKMKANRERAAQKFKIERKLDLEISTRLQRFEKDLSRIFDPLWELAKYDSSAESRRTFALYALDGNSAFEPKDRINPTTQHSMI